MASSLTCCLPLSSLQSSFLVGDTKLRSCVPTSTTHSISCRKSLHVLVRASTDRDDREGDITTQRKRRDLLAAGVAGSAAQLFLSPAFGVPITPPNLNVCIDATVKEDTTNGNVLTQCCLPKSALPAKLYVPRPGNVLKVRKRANALDPAYVEKYNEAYRLMRELPDTDPRSFKQQADVHCAFCNGAYYSAQVPDKLLQIHFNYLFFPWHRYYLYFHERILGSLIKDPTFALPYWNWDDQTDGGNVMPAIFNQIDKYPALYDTNRDVKSAPPSLAKLSLSSSNNSEPEDIINNNISVMFNSLIKPTTQTLFMGGIPPNSTLTTNSSQGSLEGSPHTAIHVFVGNPSNPNREDMGNFYSAGRDPIFYCHHANVDRCWYIWDTLPDRRKELYSDTDFLDSSFVFYDENSKLVQVSVKDCLDTKAQLGITYEPSPGSQLYRDLVPKPLGNVKGLVPKGKADLPIGVSKSKGQAPQKLDTSKTLSAVVNRPTGKAAFAAAKGIEESKVEEVLILEEVIVPSTASTYLAVYINLPSATTSTTLNCAEYVGSYANLPHIGMSMDRKTDVRLSITTNIKSLGIEAQDSLVITVVSKVADQEASQVSVGGFKIEYA